MSELLQPGHVVVGLTSNSPCEVIKFLGGGGQGEVYHARLAGHDVALKWYFPASATPAQRAQLEMAITKGPPSAKFLWPMEITEARDRQGFGYVMALRGKEYKSLEDLMTRRIKPDPSFRSLATACLLLADSYFQLHSKGLCYRDISFGNVFFEPVSGDVLICDNDNVDIDNRSAAGVLGTPRFMAPEVVRGEAMPSTQTDLYSLAVLLFYMTMMAHPLEGRKEADVKCLDLRAMEHLYGRAPLFIFDPNDRSNEPVPEIHGNAIVYWGLYPQFLKDLFTQTFTLGLKDPAKRVRETQWRAAMVRLRDSICYCPCGAENFYDDSAVIPGALKRPCWACSKEVRLPPRLRIEKRVLMLNHNTRLYRYHVDDADVADEGKPVAEVVRHPTDATRWGLKNVGPEKWVVFAGTAAPADVLPGRSVTLASGTKVQFGRKEGEIRI